LLIDTIPQTIVSESKPSAFPSALRAKRSAVQELSADDRKTEAIVEKQCAKCGRKEMFFTTVQLRSADEGSTVFYRCVCGHKYVNSISIARSLLGTNPFQGDREQLSKDKRGCTNVKRVYVLAV
jgi:DNA-directed RNA polymerase I subunit RPA12